MVTSRAQVVVIEQEQDRRQQYECALSQAGLQVVGCRSLRQALIRSEKGATNVVLVNADTSPAAVRTIREVFPAASIVAQSTSQNAGTRGGLDADTLLPRSDDLAPLKRTIQSLIDCQATS